MYLTITDDLAEVIKLSLARMNGACQCYKRFVITHVFHQNMPNTAVVR